MAGHRQLAAKTAADGIHRRTEESRIGSSPCEPSRLCPIVTRIGQYELPCKQTPVRPSPPVAADSGGRCLLGCALRHALEEQRADLAIVVTGLAQHRFRL